MVLDPGTRLGPYEISAPVGAGGMGEVYRATDTKLRRDVAIKVLPESFARDPQRLARFEREARLLAALSHPNIAAIHGLEESDGIRYLVLELVEGETLARRVSRGPMPLDETLSIIGQIASALEAAHEQGIIHRDLKPANVMISARGIVKVLDFGLARTFRESTSPDHSTDPSRSPTLTADTREGIILGTAPYMSPEQARGQVVDKRADVWALGCLLYECLTGRRPFDGATITDVLARIVSGEPELGALPRETPDFLVRLLRRCLDKNPGRRLRDTGEVRIAIEEFERDPRSEILVNAPASAGRSRARRPWLPWALAGVLGAVMIGSLYLRGPSEPEGSHPVSRWKIALPEGARLDLPRPGGQFDYSRLVAISPDGSHIAFSVQDENRNAEIHVREIEAVEPRPLEGTANARAPFFSSDGEWLGFLGAGGKIMKVALRGGSPQEICPVGRPISFDASWSPDGDTIVYATDRGLWRVSASGGSPERLTQPDEERGETGHHTPRFTPDGRGILFTISVTPETHLGLLSLETGTWEIVVRDASDGVLFGSDRMVFARSGELLTVGYDRTLHRATGTATTVLQDIHTTPGLGGVVLTDFDVSRTGTLVYVPSAATEGPDSLVWVDRGGKETPITSGPGMWVHPRLSPDGTRISLDIHSPEGMRDVYIYEIARGQMRKLTASGITWESEWRPDGNRIAVLSGAPAGHWSLFSAPTDFSGPPELLHRADHAVPSSWLPDGKTLIFTDISEGVLEGGIWKLRVGGDEEPSLVVGTQAAERHPRLSPDGRWIAYTASESGRGEVIVQSFPELGPKYQVSVTGGGEPVWSRDGRELFFREGAQVFAVAIESEPFRSGTPRVLFSREYDAAQLTGHSHWDISHDGRRFLMIKHGERSGPSEVRVVLNWQGEP